MAKDRSCAEQVVADWFDNLRVDKIYPKHCYREAIAGLGPDIKDYTGAEDAILRALQYADAGKIAPDDEGPGVTHKPIELHNTAPPDATAESVAAPPAAATTSSPSSVPVPLIVLAGLAGLLLIAGGAGYVARRMQDRRDGPPPTA